MKCYGGRALLNSEGHHSTAAIVAEVEDTSVWPDGENGRGNEIQPWNTEPYCMLQIANCDRSILFDLSWSTEEERENALDKVDTLVETLTAFRRGLKIEQRRYRKRAAETEAD